MDALAQFLPGGINAIGLIVCVAILWRADGEQERQLKAIWKWKEEHEKNAADKRVELQRELSKLEGFNLVISEQFKRIMEILEDIKERLVALERRP